jgi:hypothetical protein
MDMDWHNAALGAAGAIGSGTAIIHGVLTQRLMVRPIEALFAGDPKIKAPIRRIVPILLHFSTAAWFAGGIALIAAACCFAPGARLATALCVGGLYLFGTLGNAWATRGRHPGWMLMAAAVVLIGFGLSPAAG